MYRLDADGHAEDADDETLQYEDTQDFSRSRAERFHHADFARAFVGLLNEPRAIGDSFHITSDETLTWNQIACILAAAAGAEPRIVHVPSDAVAAVDPEWGASLLGDKAHPLVFDNSKIKSLVPGWVATVPFWQGAREIIEWHDADASRRRVDQRLDATIDQLIEGFEPGASGGA